MVCPHNSRASGRRHCSVPARTPPDTTPASNSAEFIPTELSRVSIPARRILSISDEYACRSGSTLGPSNLPHAPSQVGIHLNKLCLAYTVV